MILNRLMKVDIAALVVALLALLESIFSLPIRNIILTLVDSYHEHNNLLINHLVDKAITETAQLDFVAIGEVAEPVRLNSWVYQNICQFLLELLPDRVSQLVPLFECALVKLKTKGHPASPSRAVVLQAVRARC